MIAQPPQPDRFIGPDRAALMTTADIVAGKGGFQKADLMDFGSLYGMGSYFGEDYTASALRRLATLTEDNLAEARYGKTFGDLPSEQQPVIRTAVQHALQGLDLTRREVTLPDELAKAVVTLRDELSRRFATSDPTTGWTQAHSLSAAEAQQTANFIIYSAFTTVARRPDTTWSWTENWPYDPEVGNVPTTNTFAWTWASFCFTFLMFGVVLFIYKFWLETPDDQPKESALAKFGPLTESQRKVGKYFLVVALVLLLQIAAGAIMAHSYFERSGFYGIELQNILPFNVLRDIHIQTPIVWIGVGWIGAGLFLAPAMAGGRDAPGQPFLVDLLFYTTLVIVAGALIGNWLGVMGYIQTGWFWFGNQGLSYIQLGRFWQIGFFLGLLIWSGLVFRALWPTAAELRHATRDFWSGRRRPDAGRAWRSSPWPCLACLAAFPVLTGRVFTILITSHLARNGNTGGWWWNLQFDF